MEFEANNISLAMVKLKGVGPSYSVWRILKIKSDQIYYVHGATQRTVTVTEIGLT